MPLYWCISRERLEPWLIFELGVLISVASTMVPWRSNSHDADSKLVFFQQATEVDANSFIGGSLQAQLGKLAQNLGFVQSLFHRRIAIIEKNLYQMIPLTSPSANTIEQPPSVRSCSSIRIN